MATKFSFSILSLAVIAVNFAILDLCSAQIFDIQPPPQPGAFKIPKPQDDPIYNDALSPQMYTPGFVWKSTNEDGIPCATLAARWILRAMHEAQMCITETGDIESDRKRVKKEPLLKVNGLRCIVKCAAMRIGLLNEKGEADAFTVMNFVQNEIPRTFWDIGAEALSGCLPQVGLLNVTEVHCSSYAPLYTCVTGAAGKIVKYCNTLRNLKFARIYDAL